MRKGIAGEDYAPHVLELNRLVLLFNHPNEATFLIGAALRKLPAGKFIVSFADMAQGHNGAVYRASNFLYCGLSAKRTDWKIKGKESLHGQTVADEFRGQENRSQLMREKYGDAFYLAPRSRKYRYIYITGGPHYVKKLLPFLKYPPRPFTPCILDNSDN